MEFFLGPCPPVSIIRFFFERIAGFALSKTILAIYRAIPGGPERNLAFFFAIRADRLMQSSLPVITVLSPLALLMGMAGGLKRPVERPRLGLPGRRIGDQGIYLLLQKGELLLYLVKSSCHILLSL